MREKTRTTQDDEALARGFDALANAVRLALLRELRSPKLLGAIRVAAEGEDAVISRQSVRRHLDVLLETGLVTQRETRGTRGETTEYALNPQRLFVLAEEALELAHMRSDLEPDAPTMPLGSTAPRALPGPCLVLVHGAAIGHVFPLSPPATRWRIGRHRDVEVALDFDPFASGESAVIERAQGGHEIVDAPAGRNPTRLNLVALPRGGRARLRHGDLIGVGRSLLLYRAD